MTTEPKLSDYRVEIAPDEAGGYVATVPDLPGCMGDGRTAPESLSDLGASFAAWIEAAKEMGREIPKPGGPAKPVAVLVRFPRTLHAEGTRAAEAEGTSFNQFVVATIAACIAGRKAASAIHTKTAKRRVSDHIEVIGTNEAGMQLVGLEELGRGVKSDRGVVSGESSASGSLH